MKVIRICNGGNEKCNLFCKRFYFKMFRGVLHQTCSVRKDVLKNFAKFRGKHLCLSLFFNKVAGAEALAQVFSCEFCEISKSTFFTEYLRTTALEYIRLHLHIHVKYIMELNNHNQYLKFFMLF